MAHRRRDTLAARGASGRRRDLGNAVARRLNEEFRRRAGVRNSGAAVVLRRPPAVVMRRSMCLTQAGYLHVTHSWFAGALALDVAPQVLDLLRLLARLISRRGRGSAVRRRTVPVERAPSDVWIRARRFWRISTRSTSSIADTGSSTAREPRTSPGGLSWPARAEPSSPGVFPRGQFLNGTRSEGEGRNPRSRLERYIKPG